MIPVTSSSSSDPFRLSVSNLNLVSTPYRPSTTPVSRTQRRYRKRKLAGVAQSAIGGNDLAAEQLPALAGIEPVMPQQPSRLRGRETRVCHNCGNAGHLAHYCPEVMALLGIETAEEVVEVEDEAVFMDQAAAPATLHEPNTTDDGEHVTEPSVLRLSIGGDARLLALTDSIATSALATLNGTRELQMACGLAPNAADEAHTGSRIEHALEHTTAINNTTAAGQQYALPPRVTIRPRGRHSPIMGYAKNQLLFLFSENKAYRYEPGLHVNRAGQRHIITFICSSASPTEDEPADARNAADKAPKVKCEGRADGFVTVDGSFYHRLTRCPHAGHTVKSATRVLAADLSALRQHMHDCGIELQPLNTAPAGHDYPLRINLNE